MVLKLPPETDRLPESGISRPERVLTEITPASLLPYSAGMFAVLTSTERKFRGSGELANVEAMVSVTGMPSMLYSTWYSMPRACRRLFASSVQPGGVAVILFVVGV